MNLTLRNAVPAGQAIRWAEVIYDPAKPVISVRQEMEALFRAGKGLDPADA